MTTVEKQTRTRIVPKLGFRVLAIHNGPRPANAPEPTFEVFQPSKLFTSSEAAEASIINDGSEGFDYFIVRIQKGPLRLQKVTKLT